MTDANADAAPHAPVAEDSIPFPRPFDAWYAVIILGAVSAMSNIDRGVINLVLIPIKESFNLSDTSVSLLAGAAFSVFYVGFGLPMARLADRYSRKAILIGGLSVWSFATTLCGLAQTYWHLFAARALVGAGESVKGPCSVSMISDLVPQKHLPRAFAIYHFGIAVGMSGAFIVGGFLLQLFANSPPLHLPFGIVVEGWHKVFMACGIPGLLLAVLMIFTVREPARQGRERPDQPSIGEVARFLWKNKLLYGPLLLATALDAVQMYGFFAWRPAFFERTYGWGPEVAGPLLGTAMLIATPVGLFLGAAITEFMQKRSGTNVTMQVFFVAHCISLPLSVATYFMPTPELALVFIVLHLTALYMAYPAQTTAVQIVTPNEMRAQTAAVFLFPLGIIGGGFGPTLVALITDQVFADESMLRYSMALFAAVMEPLALLMIFLAMVAYGRRLAELNAVKAR